MALPGNAGLAAGSTSADASAEVPAGSASPPEGNGVAATDDAARQKYVDIGIRKGLQRAEKMLDAERERVRRATLEELGFHDDDAIARHKAMLAESDKARPEYERRAIDNERKAKELAEKLAATDKALQEQGAQFVAERRGRIVSNVIRSANLHPDAEDELDSYLERHTHQAADGRLVFRHGELEVDFNPRDAASMAKIAAHVTATKGYMVKPTMSPGAGSSAATRPSNGTRPMTPEEDQIYRHREMLTKMGHLRPQ